MKVVYFFAVAAFLGANAATYYVFPQGVDGAGRGSRETPFATLEHAVSVASDGDAVKLLDGIYARQSTGYLVVDKALSIESENGAGSVAIEGTGNGCLGIRIAHENAILKGITVRNCSLSGANAQGIGIDILKGTVQSCVISNCTALSSNHGSAVKISGGGRLSSSTVACNKGTASGGLDRMGGGILIIDGVAEDCEIYGNSSMAGGGAALNGAQAILRNSLIYGNSTVVTVLGDKVSTMGAGGGICLKNGIVENCRIYGNTAHRHGGVSQSGGTIRSSLIYGNSAMWAVCGGIYTSKGSANNLTVYGNHSPQSAGCDLLLDGGTACNLFVLPSPIAGPGTAKIASQSQITYSALPISVPGEGNIVADPSHFDMKTKRPYPGSPLAEGKDLGGEFTTDVNGEPRPSAFGKGALNPFSPGERFAAIEASAYEGKIPLSVSFVLRSGEEPESVEWVFPGGETSAGNTAQALFAEAGEFSVTARAVFRDGGSIEQSQTIKVSPGVVYCSGGGASVWPYDTMEKAATNVQDAVDAVYADFSERGEVRILAGTYSFVPKDESKTFSPMVTVKKNIWLRGTGNSGGDVVLDAKKKRQVLYVANENAVIDNLTMSNGRYDFFTWYSSGNLILGSGTVSNSVIKSGYGYCCGNASLFGGTVAKSVIKDGTLVVSGVDRPAGGINICADATVVDCLIANNQGGYGAGLYIGAGAAGAVVKGCDITGNYNAICGGGGAALLSGLAEGCFITNNIANGGGGGLVVAGGTARNCVVAFNSARGQVYGFGYSKGGGGGIAIKSGKVENCTIYENSSVTSSGWNLYQTGGTVANTVIASDRYEAQSQIYKTGGTLSYCAVPVEGVGDNCLVGSPLLSNPAKGDFTLLYGSPCVDAGQALPDVKTDMAGTERPKGEGYDIGCHEMDFAGRLVCGFDVSGGEPLNSFSAVFTATVANGGEPIHYTWDFGDGQSASGYGLGEVRHDYSCGDYSVSLTVTDASGCTATQIRNSAVRVYPGIAYASEKGKAIWPYDTWEKATPVVQDAIDAVYKNAAGPGIVMIADGRYKARGANDVFVASLHSRVALVGTNKTCGAVLDGENTRRVALVSHSEAGMYNLAVERGRYMKGDSPCAVMVSGGTVSNVTIRNSAGYYGGLGLYGGVFTDGVISNNLNTSHTGADRKGGGAYIEGGILSRTLIKGNVNGRGGAVYMIGGTVQDCVIAGNRSYSYGNVHMTGGTVSRCIITNNTLASSVASPAASGVFMAGSGAYLGNSLVALNSSASFPGLYLATGASTVNCTVYDNRISGGNRNILSNGGIVANTAAGDMEGTGTYSSNLIGQDPLFTDREAGDYTIKRSSPCHNSGDNAYHDPLLHPLDLMGKRRLRYGKIDIGAYEYNGMQGISILLR